MAKRRRKKTKSRSTSLAGTLFLVFLLGGGAWLAWERSKGREVRLPNFTALSERLDPWLQKGTNVPAGAEPANERTNAPDRERERSPAERVQTNAPLPELTQHEPKRFRNVETVLDAQIALARKGISVGPIDGAAGVNMRRALVAWQVHNNLSVSGELDAETKAALLVEEPLFTQYRVTEEDLGRLMTVPEGWLGKSKVDRLDYESIQELVAERGRASVAFIRGLNPGVDWTKVRPGALVRIPRIEPPPLTEKAAFVRVHLYTRTLDVFGKTTNLIAHFPCSIAKRVDKRPVGRLTVARTALNPTYLFDPEIFSESPEAKRIGRKLVIPPGPNNPVGTAWIGLDRPGYGIHGTPKPEQVGRTESHGCFRLANWNAEHLLQLAWTGLPVYVEE